jgi:hypothetical protein
MDVTDMVQMSDVSGSWLQISDVSGIQHKSFLTIRTRNNQPKTTHNIETIDRVDLLWKPTKLKQLIVTTNDPQSCKIDTCHLEDIALGPWFLAEESVMI